MTRLSMVSTKTGEVKLLTCLLTYFVFTDDWCAAQPRKPTRRLSSRQQSRSSDLRADAEVPNFMQERVENDGTKKVWDDVHYTLRDGDTDTDKLWHKQTRWFNGCVLDEPESADCPVDFPALVLKVKFLMVSLNYIYCTQDTSSLRVMCNDYCSILLQDDRMQCDNESIVSRLHRLFPPSEAVWRLTSSAAAIQLSSPRSDSFTPAVPVTVTVTVCWKANGYPVSSITTRNHGRKSAEFTGWPKKFRTVILYALTLPNINRFSKSFHYQNREKICNNTVTNDPTTPQVCHYIILWNVTCIKNNSWKQDDFHNNTF